MKIRKGWKITWITLGSLVGLVVVTVIVALWLIFTPSKLTKIVNSLAGNFITCDASFGNVDLTLLSTFPDAGLKIENVVLVNPLQPFANDTLAKIGSLTVGIDIKAFLKDNKVIVHQVILDDATANLYINRDGEANFDIFPKSEKEDTSSSKLPELIDLKKIKITNLNADFVSYKDGAMSAEVAGMDMDLKGTMEGENVVAKMKMEAEQFFFSQGERALLSAHARGLEAKVVGKKEDKRLEAEVKLGGKEVDFEQLDSLGNHTLKAALDDLLMKVEGKGDKEEMRCQMRLVVEKGMLNAGGTEMINEKLRQSKKDLLQVEMPDVVVSLNKKEVWLSDTKIKIDDYGLMVNGYCRQDAGGPGSALRVDMAAETDGDWRVAPLLDIIPAQYVSFRKGMELDGEVGFAVAATGSLTDSTMPGVSGTITLNKGRFHAPKMLPYKIEKVKGSLKIESLKAHTRGTDVSLSGRVDDLLGDMRVDAKVKGTLPLEDAMPMVPKGMKLSAKGDANFDLTANFKMSQLQKQAFEKMKASGSLKLKDVDVSYDTMHATAPTLDVALQLPAKDMMAGAHIKSGKLKVISGKTIKAEMENANIDVRVNNMMKKQLAAAFSIETGDMEAEIDSMVLSMSDLNLNGTVRLDSTQRNVIKQYNPRFNATTHNVLLYTPKLPETMHLTEFDMAYTPTSCNLKTAKVRLGHSDFELYGEVENLEDWLDDKAVLRGDLNFTSEYADVDQLMNMISGMGNDPDSLEIMRKEDAVPEDAHPFIVPRNVNLTLHTHVKRSIAFGNDLHDVAGALTINDGKVIFDQIGFVCKAATMQLTALYKSQRPGHLFAAVDFHLLDIQIDELLDMIPAVDTLVPMLSAFNGNANFHFAGESFMDANYHLKMPTLKGAAAISGKDLVVMDNSDIATIAKLMRFKSWKDKDNKIKIDSLSVELTCMDDGHGSEIEVLPFLLCMGSYKICASGVQQFNKDCVYHIELLKNPLLAKIGVDVKGSLAHPKISLGKIRYADMFRPKHHGVAEKKALEIKAKTRKALEAKVR